MRVRYVLQRHECPFLPGDKFGHVWISPLRLKGLSIQIDSVGSLYRGIYIKNRKMFVTMEVYTVNVRTTEENRPCNATVYEIISSTLAI